MQELAYRSISSTGHSSFMQLSGMLKSSIFGVQGENSYNIYRDYSFLHQILKSKLLNYSRDPSSAEKFLLCKTKRKKISHFAALSTTKIISRLST